MEVVLAVTKTCHHCAILEKELKRLGVSYRVRYCEDHPEMTKLLNGASAAAPGVIAGALRDHKRAVVTGERSFGKSFEQVPFRLSDDWAINLTIGLYAGPEGCKYEGAGVIPDVVVSSPSKDEAATLDTASEILKGSRTNRIFEMRSAPKQIHLEAYRSPEGFVEAQPADSLSRLSQ